MSLRALLTQSDLTRIAKAAKASGCRAEIRYGNATVVFIPDDAAAPEAKSGVIDGIDYSRPVL